MTGLEWRGNPWWAGRAAFSFFPPSLPRGLFFIGSLAGSLRSSGPWFCLFSRSLRGFDLDFGFVRQSIGTVGDHFVSLIYALDDLHIVTVANAEFHRLLMRQAIRTSLHHRGRSI